MYIYNHHFPNQLEASDHHLNLEEQMSRQPLNLHQTQQLLHGQLLQKAR